MNEDPNHMDLEWYLRYIQQWKQYYKSIITRPNQNYAPTIIYQWFLFLLFILHHWLAFLKGFSTKWWQLFRTCLNKKNIDFKNAAKTKIKVQIWLQVFWKKILTNFQKTQECCKKKIIFIFIFSFWENFALKNVVNYPYNFC